MHKPDSRFSHGYERARETEKRLKEVKSEHYVLLNSQLGALLDTIPGIRAETQGRPFLTTQHY